MSQQRQCCCGPQQDFGHECLAYDKIFRAYRNDNNSPADFGSGNVPSYQQRPQNPPRTADAVQSFYRKREFSQPGYALQSVLPTRHQAYDHSDPSFNDLKSRNPDNITGMGCMLCHGTLIMETKLPRYSAEAGGIVGDFCNQTNCAAVNYKFSYDRGGWALPAETTQYIAYHAYKDYWYLELGPSGFPFSYRDNGPDLRNASYINGKFYSLDDGRLGVRTFGGDIQSNSNCWAYPQHPAITTDADLQCYPELSAMTNPANVHFGWDIDGGGSWGGREGIQAAMAARIPGVDNNEPELASHDTSNAPQVKGNYLCTYMESNINPWVNLNTPTFNYPCGGNFMPGVSAWQAYICRSQPEYRTLGDTFSFGNGLPIFTPPESMVEGWLNSGGEPNDNYGYGYENLGYAPLQNSMVGTLYRVRLWVRADHITINYRYPCEDANGEVHSHWPPETNRRLRQSYNRGGYGANRKLCGSGPASLMYACSGVPVFTSDLEMMREQDYEVGSGILDKLSQLYYGDWDRTEPGLQFANSYKNAKCLLGIGQIEDSLGDSGLYTAKDWRIDQLNKYSTLESEYKLIGEQNKDNPNLSDDDRVALEKLSEGVSVPGTIKTRITPPNPESNPTGPEIELLPAQKFGEMMLTCFITRSSAKQRADSEIGTQLLSEMAYFQASQYNGSSEGFDIDYIDPWHPSNTGGVWPKLGRNRVDPATGQEMSFSLSSPDGVTERFDFYYPVRKVWNAWRAQANPSAGPFTDDEWELVAPDWERKLFKLWWKNNPIYFHATPGGWSWAGDGLGNLSDGFFCRWTNRPKFLGTLESLHQLQWWGTGRASLACGFNETWPNRTHTQPGSAGAIMSHSFQLRNRPAVKSCRVISSTCVKDCRARSKYIACDGICCDEGETACAGWTPGSGICSNVGECAGRRVADGYQMFNCCENYTPYGGSNREGSRAKATASYYMEEPISVDTDEINGDKQLLGDWNNSNPSQSFKDGSLYGSRCTEQGNCPPGYKCCSPTGCGGNNFCIPESLRCDTEPCSSANNFEGPCCNTFGSCCYVDKDGVTRCEYTSREKCIAPKKNGGLNGSFNKDVPCDTHPCRTDGVTGACFYTDPLLNHQICRETFSDTCTDLAGEFFANQDCSEFSDKETTAFERKTGVIGSKPTETGDKTCGEYGFSVKCCTETTGADGQVSYVCENKCMSDCDHGRNGKSRIVSDCEACGELGHCCSLNGFCEPNVTEAACAGTWFPGAECDVDSCEIPLTENWRSDVYGSNRPGLRPYKESQHPSGLRSGGSPGFIPTGALDPDPEPDDGGSGDEDPGCDITPCEGKQNPPTATLDVCLPSQAYFGHLATHWSPYPPTTVGDPGLCHVQENTEAFRTCVIRQVQSSRYGLRYAFFRSRQDSDGFNSFCPPPANTTFDCCCYACNPAYYQNASLTCRNDAEPLGDWSLHRDMGTIVSFVYPWRVRCREQRDEQGLYRCAVLPISEKVRPTDMPIGIIGAGDILTCHYRQIFGGNEDVGTDICYNHSPYCDDGACNSNSGEWARLTRYSGAELEGGYRVTPEINVGSACVNLSPEVMTRAYSIPFPGDALGQQNLYAPAWGVGGIPKVNCASSYATVDDDRPPSSGLPMGTLGQCAEFYHDKLLSDFEGDGFPEPPDPTIELTFHDYGGLIGTYQDNRTEPPTDVPLGTIEGTPIGSELVDANWNGDENDPTFWLKQEFPGIKYIRFFSAGCFRVPGSHQGGWPEGITLDAGLETEQRVGGGFAGTMVVVFGDEEECSLFDQSYGSENLRLSFLTTPPGYENVGGDGINPRITDDEVYFVGRPSFNLRNVDPNTGAPSDEDLSYSSAGYLNGLGLTYANVSNGEQGPYVGKVYEFCVPTTEPNVNQLKPIFLSGEQIPAFSGLRGPIALYGDGSGDDGGKFTVQLQRFRDKKITDESLGTCLRYWTGIDRVPDDVTNPEYLGFDIMRGSETTIGNSDEYCFYAGYTFDDEYEPPSDGNGGGVGGGNGDGFLGGGGGFFGGDGSGDDDDDPYPGIDWSREWYANVSGITDGGAIACCHQDYADLPCQSWEFGGAGGPAGTNVYRRANTSDDCRVDL